MSPALSTTKSNHGTILITRTKTRTDSSSRITANIIIVISGAIITTVITTKITITTTATAAGDSIVTNLTITTKSEIGTTTNSGQTTTTRKIKTRTPATIERAGVVASTKARGIRAALVLGVGVGVKAPAIRIGAVILGDRGGERGIALGHDRNRGHAPRSRRRRNLRLVV